MMEIISQVVLLIAASMAAIMSYRVAQNEQEARRIHTLVISLAGTFIALAVLAEILLTSPDQDTATLRRILTNLATYAGLPLISSALLALARGWEWSSAAWGRWLLVLFALFELCRRSGVGVEYSEGLAVAIAAAWLGAALMLTSGTAKTLAIVSGLFCTAALLLHGPHSIFGESDPVGYNLRMAAALILLSFQIGQARKVAA